MPSPLSTEETFQQLADVLTYSGYPDFFSTLVQRLAEVLGVEYCLVAEVTDPSDQARTLAIWGGGSLLDNFTYSLRGTPCEKVVELGPCLYESDVCAVFPQDQLLIDMGVQSYLGMPLTSVSGDPLGLLSIMDTSPLSRPDVCREVLRIAAAQVSAELERSQNKHYIRKLTYRDTITKLPNRAHLLEQLQQSAKELGAKTALGVALIDISRFKELNDLFSFKVGDEILAAAAKRMRDDLPESCYLARYSADQFALLSHVYSVRELEQLCRQVQKLFMWPFHCAGRDFALNVNLGCALVTAEELNGPELLRFASIALAEAKSSGSGLKMFEPSMSQALSERQKVLEKFMLALRSGKLSLNYQPQLDLASGLLSGAEALCRWHDDEWGWVSPDTFIPLAEERGLMPELGNWVMQTACRQLNLWQQQGYRLPGRLSINVSARQLDNEQLVSDFAICSNGIVPTQIELEMTESLIMRNPEQSLRQMAELEAMGFSWAIDDFGTGYSSLAYLTRFHASTLKIDRAFINNIPGDHHHNMVVKTILAMAKSLDMLTIAEGVETAEQADYLLQLGCARAQGYHFGKPVPADEFAERWLKPLAVKS
jgi:diguanylate cyclase (GGDEF)-like protein